MFLLQNNGDIATSVSGDQSQTVLHWACADDTVVSDANIAVSADVIKLLIRAGCDSVEDYGTDAHGIVNVASIGSASDARDMLCAGGRPETDVDVAPKPLMRAVLGMF